MIKTIIRYLPSIAWMGLIFYLSSRQTAGVITSDPAFHFYIFKTFHLIEYALLTVLLYFGSKKILSSIVIAYLYAVSDEIHQYFTPGRSPALRDTLVDVVGITFGLIVIQFFLRINPIKRLFRTDQP